LEKVYERNRMDNDEAWVLPMMGMLLVLAVYASKQRTRKFWVNPFLRSRHLAGRFFTGVRSRNIRNTK